MHRSAALATVSIAALLGGGAVASGARPSAVPTPTLTAEPAVVAPGETLTIEARGFPPDARIVLRAGPVGSKAERIGTARTGRRGSFTAEIAIRDPSAGGRYVVLGCHDRCRVKASARFRIVAR